MKRTWQGRLLLPLLRAQQKIIKQNIGSSARALQWAKGDQALLRYYFSHPYVRGNIYSYDNWQVMYEQGLWPEDLEEKFWEHVRLSFGDQSLMPVPTGEGPFWTEARIEQYFKIVEKAASEPCRSHALDNLVARPDLPKHLRKKLFRTDMLNLGTTMKSFSGIGEDKVMWRALASQNGWEELDWLNGHEIFQGQSIRITKPTPQNEAWGQVPWPITHIIVRKLLGVVLKNPQGLPAWSTWSNVMMIRAVKHYPPIVSDMWRLVFYMKPVVALQYYFQWSSSERPNVSKVDLLWLFQHPDREVRLGAMSLVESLGARLAEAPAKVDEAQTSQTAQEELATPKPHVSASGLGTPKSALGR